MEILPRDRSLTSNEGILQVLDSKVAYIQKPFTHESLALRVREVLNAA